MSSLKAAMKGHQKTHRERGQVTGRKHLGLLEKRKDYKLRAKDFHRKEKAIKRLKQKAADKNPDEFYFKMINQRTQDGIRVGERQDGKKYTSEQMKLLKTQDLNYINLKKNTEAKKIKKLQANLHLTEVADAQERSHVFFVDTKEEEKNFDAAEQMNTLPELLSRSHNIPTLDILRNVKLGNIDDRKQSFSLTKEKKKAYKELQSRIEREKMLGQTRQEMFLKRHLSGKGTVHKRKSKEGNTSYRWKKSRKR